MAHAGADAQSDRGLRAIGRVGRAALRCRTGRLGLAAVVLALLGVLGACAPPPPATPLAIVYGDSLVSESRTEIERRIGQDLAGWDVLIRHFGGTAQCDWHAHMHADASLRPDVVVLAFSGNRLTPCTQRPYPQLYEDDATWATKFWRAHGAEVAFVGAPPAVGSSTAPVADRYRAVGLQMQVPFESASSLFVDPVTGLAVMQLPCLPTETPALGCQNGLITVRNADGAHLCAAAGCHSYSSGTARYADVVVAAVGRAASVSSPRLPIPTVPPTTSVPDATDDPEAPTVPDGTGDDGSSS